MYFQTHVLVTTADKNTWFTIINIERMFLISVFFFSLKFYNNFKIHIIGDCTQLNANNNKSSEDDTFRYLFKISLKKLIWTISNYVFFINTFIIHIFLI